MAKTYKPGKGYSRKDWDAVSDNPELADEQMSKAKPFAASVPELAASIRRGRGPNKAPTKTLVSSRLSGKVIEKYKAGGPGWQSRIDQDLRRINKIK
ncbi:BrnA antitoxin family protein [Bradyrhizobium sp. AUGA SZCCT0283]|uniref:BrnA antitoxin family protein n=1 Tax=Bradyrhizobium sp. AUGA SZCCT0283 TaxID=2807671 RepID=UPI001BADA154|nr:BrnA antitoxin family protein [Bradyrhizobium sp. AUGA SZCCT0283]MBR1276651.1 BrnA antitoxin family protein [Bradyrhizobium sp. AUGA SZCCT0283]